MCSLVDDLAVDLITEHPEIMFDRQFRDSVQIVGTEHSAGGVLGRIDDQHFRLVICQSAEVLDVEGKILLLGQLQRDRLALQEIDHRFIDGKTRIGIDDFVAGIDQGSQGKIDDGLAPGHDHHVVGTDIDTAIASNVLGENLSHIGHAGGGTVMRVP